MPPTRRRAERERSRGPARFRRALAAALLLCAAGCTEKLESIGLPGLELPGADRPQAGAAPAGSGSGAPRAQGAPGPSAAASAGPRAQAAASDECDELPSEEEERRAQLPPLTALGKVVRAEPWTPPPYKVLPGVTLPAKIAAKLEKIDRGYARRTRGEHLVITSGTRDANRQARAMFTKLKLGEDLLQLYRNKAAAREITRAYQANARKPPEQVVEAMEAVIRDQIDRGIYISAHLRKGAVDVRNRTMSSREKRAFLESAAEVGGVRVIAEATPPHYHLQID
ncbi:hypothetical protein WMF31_39605 [Sorangium sp. So ce1036]|uniref:hypothetical protein n=1 Tax=Sorangium sp. So ce1036 TaxID=3133328 RepID=UPI003F0E6A3B